MTASLLIGLLLAAQPAPTAATAVAPAAAAPNFARDIAPIFKARCYECHGSETQESGLRLDVRIRALEGGDHGPLFVPKDSSQGELIRRVASTDADLRMPPDGDPLTVEQVALLKRWIDAGADWPDDGIRSLKRESDHWAFQPPKRHEPPAVKNEHSVRSPIDRFILARLEEEGIAPSRDASRQTLLRRVFLDLTGLPPTPDEMDEFLVEAGPNAYERLVDRLLASEHFGERWGRHWLDLARYADSNGYELDTVRPNAWRYRDWVINAINDDMPFDRFTIEQLAGDLLPAATLDQEVAVGFHQMTINNTESGINKEDYRNREIVDRVNTVGSVFLGLTVGCAQCHSHKYDPISQREYYRLYAFFNHTERLNRDIDGTPAEQQAFQAAKVAFEAKSRRLKNRQRILQSIQKEGADKWRASVVAENAKIEEKLAALREVYALGANDWMSLLTEQQRDQLGPSDDVKAALAVETPQRTDKQRDVLFDYFKSLPKQIADLSATIHSPREQLADLDEPPGLIEAVLTDETERIAEQTQQLADFRSTLDARVNAVVQDVRQLSVEERYLPKPAVMTMVERPDEKRQTHVLLRGEFKQHGAVVQPATFAVLNEFRPRGETPDRLDLAEWLVAPANPLTARVAVNRIWQHLFGRGFVETVDDFGHQGARPSHPELLDWLALELQRLGWSQKKLIREIVLSSTYRQCSQHRPELQDVDPLNTLLARQSRFRVEAEIVRDLFLTAGGLLHREVGGPTIRPDVPDSIRDLAYKYRLVWPVDGKPQRYRRGLYIHFRRSNPYPSLMAFDCPESNATQPQRNRSNTPLQALTTLNDPVFVEGAQALGQRILLEGPPDADGRIQFAGRICLTRELEPMEVETLTKLYEEERQAYEADVDAAIRFRGEYTAAGHPDYETAAWVAVARALLNLDEFLTRE